MPRVQLSQGGVGLGINAGDQTFVLDACKHIYFCCKV